MKLALILTFIFVPLVLILYYFGFGVTRAGVFILNASYSLPTRWEGKLSNASGYLRRNFAVFQKYSTLSVEAETASGALDIQVKAPDGSVLSPVSGAYGRDAGLLFDVSRLRRCSVALHMDHFSGNFRIALQ